MRDGGYRTSAEVDEWKSRDPIQGFRTRMVAEGAATDEELDRIDADVKAEMDKAFEFAKSSPWPDPATATTPPAAGRITDWMMSFT